MPPGQNGRNALQDRVFSSFLFLFLSLSNVSTVNDVLMLVKKRESLMQQI